MAQYRRRSSTPTWLMPLLFLLGGVVLVGGGLVALGVVHFGPAPFVPPPGTTKCLVSSKTIPVYTRISRDVMEPITFQWIPTAAIHSGVYIDIRQVSGRVLNHDKPPYYPFTEDDFFPRGTKEGPEAGVPEGKRALTIEAGQISGVTGLRIGDHFDIVATTKVDQGTLEGGANGTYKPYVHQMLGLHPQAEVRVIVQNGVVVEPVRTRVVPTTSNSLMNGSVTRTRPVQEIVLAVEPTEVAPLTEAIAVGAVLSCTLRSSRPGDDKESITPGSKPKTFFDAGADGNGTGFAPVEVVDDKGRSMHVAPKSRQPNREAGNQ